MQPPKDIAPSELFLKLTETPAPSEVIDFPRRDANGNWVGKIRITVLPHEKHDAARIDANKRLREKGFSADDLAGLTMREVLGDAVAKELLAMACVTSEPQLNDENGQPIYGRIFRSAKDLDKLRADEIAVLYNAYLLTQQKYGPYPNDPDVELWIKKLMEGGQAFPFLYLSSPDLVNLASSFAERVWSMSRVLESQWAQLPASLQSDLAKFSLGIGFWSSPLDDSDLTSTASSHDIDVIDAMELTAKTREIESLNRARQESK